MTTYKSNDNKIDEMYAMQINAIKKVKKRSWIQQDTESTLILAKKMKLEQSLIDIVYSADENLGLSVTSIRESMITAIQEFEIQKIESKRIAKALSC